MAQLTPAQLLNLASERIARQRVNQARTDGVVELVDTDNPSGPKVRLTEAEYDARIVRAASIMLAESGGKTDARCYNYDGPNGPTCSPTPLPAGTKGTQRGVDRGLWQFNSVAWPQVDDLMADDPDASTDAAFRASRMFSSWGPWRGSRGLDPQSQPSRTIAAQWEQMMGRAVDDTPILSQLDPNADGNPVDGVLGGVLGWAEALGRLLTNLIDPAWWRRIGIGALGILLVILAVVLIAVAGGAQRGGG